MTKLSLINSCGECTACCTVLAIQELGKPPGKDCKYLATWGCGIYNSRPGTCREFRCGWLNGLGGAGQRPDRLGVVLSQKDVQPKFIAMVPHAIVFVAFETHEDAFDEPGAVEYMREVGERAVIIGLRGRSNFRRIVGPEDVIGKMATYLDERGVRDPLAILDGYTKAARA